jgi:hypothetical protein
MVAFVICMSTLKTHEERWGEREREMKLNSPLQTRNWFLSRLGIGLNGKTHLMERLRIKPVNFLHCNIFRGAASRCKI